GLDVLWTAAVVTQRFAQCKNILREVVFFDKRVGPNFFQQLIFLDQLARILHKRNQDFGRLRCERNAFTLASKDTLARIQLIWSEFVTKIIVVHMFSEIRSRLEVVVSHGSSGCEFRKTLSDKESNNAEISNENVQNFSVSPRFADGDYEASSH